MDTGFSVGKIIQGSRPSSVNYILAMPDASSGLLSNNYPKEMVLAKYKFEGASQIQGGRGIIVNSEMKRTTNNLAPAAMDLCLILFNSKTFYDSISQFDDLPSSVFAESCYLCKLDYLHDNIDTFEMSSNFFSLLPVENNTPKGFITEDGEDAIFGVLVSRQDFTVPIGASEIFFPTITISY